MPAPKPLPPITARDMQRIMRHVDVSGDCWVWSAQRLKTGYGITSIKMRPCLAHRVLYTWHVGPIPDGLEIDHLCRSRSCVNLAHLEAVSHRVNMLRGDTVVARKAANTHCPHGHPYSGDNLRSTKGGRRCKECAHQRDRGRWPARSAIRSARSKAGKVA